MASPRCSFRTDRIYAYNSIMQQLADTRVKSIECLKLVLLFALRYEREGPRQVWIFFFLVKLGMTPHRAGRFFSFFFCLSCDTG